jgi:hyperosmotically inducible protein
MNKQHLIIVLGAFLALASANCERRGVADSVITAMVKSKLAVDNETSSANINVDTMNGVVTLTGVVTTQANKEQAERIARSVEGVTRVINNITVETNGNHAGMSASDLAILSKIKTRYVAEGVIGPEVEVKDGMVTLTGNVENTQIRIRAENIARATSGVKQVNNWIEVSQ